MFSKIFFSFNRKFAHLTSSILVGKGVSAGNPRQLSKHLPDFLWLFRDDTLDSFENERGEPMTATEYLRQNVLNEDKKCEDVNPLLQLFPTLKCSILPPPPQNPQRYPTHPANSSFLQEVQATIQMIDRAIKPKKGFNGASVNGPLLVTLIRQYEKTINKSGTIPNLEVTWLNAIELHLMNASDALVKEYVTEMEQHILGRLPIEEGCFDQHRATSDTLFGIHSQILSECLDHLDNEMKRLLLPTGSQDLASSELQETQKRINGSFSKRIIVFNDSKVLCGGELFHFVQKNKYESDKRCREVFESEYKKMIDCVSTELLTNEYNKRAVGPAKASVFNEEIQNIPGPPMDVNVESSCSTKLLLSWNVPNVHQDSAKEYEIQMRNGSSSWQEKIILWWKASNFTKTGEVSDLSPNTEYSFRIRGKNWKRFGEYSDPVTLRTYPAPPKAPLKPMVKQISPQQARIIIQGTKPGGDNTCVVDKIRVESGFIGESTGSIQEYKTVEMSVEPDQFPVKHDVPLQSQDEKGDYYYQVRFGNQAGYGDPSDKVTVKTADLIPGQPICAKTTCCVTSLTFNWKPPNIHPHSVDKYEVKIKKKGDGKWTTYSVLETSITVDSLQAMTEYQYEIWAKNRHLEGKAFTDFVSTEAACPNKPKMPSLHVIDSQNVTVTILKLKKEDENGKPVTHVKIERSQDQENWESLEFEMESQKQLKKCVMLCTTSQKNEVVTFLFFRVSMRNEKGWSQPSEEAELKDDDLIPSAPTDLQVMSDKCGPREIWLKWKEPSFHAHKVKKYQVIVNVSDEPHTFECEVPSYKIPEVIPNTTYAIRVRSLNNHRDGESSEEIRHTTPYAPPNSPSTEHIQVDVISPKEAQLHIQLPMLQWGEKPVTHVIVQKSRESSKWEHELESQTNCSEGEVVSLISNYSAYMRIFLKSDVGISEPSKFVHIPNSSIIPGMPENLKVTKFTSTSVTLSWEKPVANAKAAKRYSIEWKKYNEDNWKALYSIDKMENEISELTPSTSLEFRVCAVNCGVQGYYCQPCLVTTLPKTPNAPGIRMINYKSAVLIFLKTDFDGGTEMHVETCNESEEWVQCANVTLEDTDQNDVENPLVCYYTVEFSGKPIHWRIQLVNAHFKSEYSDQVTLSDDHFIPGAPSELMVSRRTNTSITLAWKEPSKDQHPESVAHYEIREAQDLVEHRATHDTECTIGNLNTTTMYTFKVYACNKQDKKAECACIEQEPLCPIPGAPTNFRLAGANKSVIKVRWHPPRENAGAVKEYEVHYSISGKSSFEKFATYASPKTSAVISGLQSGTSHDFKIYSVNKYGQKSEEAECYNLKTKPRKAFKFVVGVAAAIPTFGAGALATHLMYKDDDDVYESP